METVEITTSSPNGTNAVLCEGFVKLIKKPCPFCCNPNAPENDTGGACCFCDYEGVVSIGHGGNFSNIEQYNKLYYATSHKERIDELHGRNDAESSRDFL